MEHALPVQLQPHRISIVAKWTSLWHYSFEAVWV